MLCDLETAVLACKRIVMDDKLSAETRLVMVAMNLVSLDLISDQLQKEYVLERSK